MGDNIREEDFYQPDNGLDVFEEGRDVADKVDNPDDLGDVCDAGNALELSSIILINGFAKTIITAKPINNVVIKATRFFEKI